MISKYLPGDFDAAKPVAVIAGMRLYPKLTAEAIRRRGVPARLIAFEDETDEDLVRSFPEAERAVIKVGQLGKLLKALQKLGAGYAIMVGQIQPRRLFRGLHPDVKALRVLNSLKERNAETIFGAICREVENTGVKILDARSFLDEEMAEEGLMTGGKLKADKACIAHGIRIAREAARLDIGQGVVARKGTVLAVEAFEGTDEMLLRAGQFKTEGLIFVKAVKPEQDWRFDVPVFGLTTLGTMRRAGIGTACLEAGSVIILEKDKVLSQARQWGIQLHGFSSRLPAQSVAGANP